MKPKKHIMLIDDDPVVNYLNTSLITRLDPQIQISVFDLPDSALDYIENTLDPELNEGYIILIDVNMPRINGWELIASCSKRLSKMKKRPIIIVLTSSDDENDFERARIWHFIDAVYKKPLTEEIITSMIQKYF